MPSRLSSLVSSLPMLALYTATLLIEAPAIFARMLITLVISTLVLLLSGHSTANAWTFVDLAVLPSVWAIFALIVLRTYPGWVAARVVVCAFLNAMRPLASWSRARWFSGFLDQRMSSPRLRFIQECVASTTQRLARQPGVRALSLISSPRVRMCGV